LISNKRGFTKACLNITSLPKHNDELRIILLSKCLDLLTINETRLHDIIADNEVSVDGYDIVRRDRPLNGRNGDGVCFYIRSNINIMIFARSSYLINWNAFLSKLVNQEVNLLLLLHGTDLLIHLLNYSPILNPLLES